MSRPRRAPAAAPAPPDRVRFTAAGAARGGRAMLPILPGVVAFGLLYGFLAGQRGLSGLEVALMSAFVFAGASQFVALELWQQPLPVLALVAAVLIVNLRHLLMGPVLLPWLGALPPAKAYASLYFMTDESWGMSVAEMRQGGSDAAFLPGAGLTLWLFWVGSSVGGRLIGDVSALVERWGLDYLTTAFFVALLAGFWRGRGDLAPWLVAALAAVLAREILPGTWYILAGALAGSLVGAAADVRRAR